MDAFVEMREMGHERVLLCSNPEVGLQAIIAIHSTVLGPGLGGTRMWPYESFDAALTDALRLSRGMTYKAAAAGINLGGAKAVIVGDPKQDKSEALFRAFGRFVDSLGGHYITAEDVGTSTADMELIAQETPWVTGVAPELGGGGDPSPVTALGVLQGIRASAQTLWGTTDLASRTVAVQGLGSVGGYLATYLKDEGAKIIGCDIDAQAIAEARELGVEIVAPDAIYDVDCDIFAPCALGAILNDDTIPRLKAKAVAGGANNQLADAARHGVEIERRGILYAPDFVINAGGLINVFQEFVGYDQERALRRARGIYDNVLRVFSIARRDNIPSAVAADRMAEARIADVKKLGPRHWERAVLERLAG
ncbi:MAG: Glu/Leu/Phe/Val dehydrogenase dimerization domain-containing protein [Thermoanaerobaculia bacterium]